MSDLVGMGGSNPASSAKARASLASGSPLQEQLGRQRSDNDSERKETPVSERMYAAGLIDAWDYAVRSRNRRRIIELLTQVGLADEGKAISDTVLCNPE